MSASTMGWITSEQGLICGRAAREPAELKASSGARAAYEPIPAPTSGNFVSQREADLPPHRRPHLHRQTIRCSSRPAISGYDYTSYDA